MSYNKPSSLNDEAIDAASNKSASLASRDGNMMEEEYNENENNNNNNNNSNNNPGSLRRFFRNVFDKPSSKNSKKVKIPSLPKKNKRPTTSSASDVSSEPASKRRRPTLADFIASDKHGNFKRPKPVPVVPAEESTITDGRRRCRHNMDDDDITNNNITNSNSNSNINNSNITSNNINNSNINNNINNNNGIHDGSSIINDNNNNNNNNNDRPNAGMELDDERRTMELPIVAVGIAPIASPWSLEEHKNVLIGIQRVLVVLELENKSTNQKELKLKTPKEIATDIFKSKLVPTRQLLDIQMYVATYLRAYQNTMECKLKYNGCKDNKIKECTCKDINTALKNIKTLDASSQYQRDIIVYTEQITERLKKRTQLYGAPTIVAPSSRPSGVNNNNNNNDYDHDHDHDSGKISRDWVAFPFNTENNKHINEVTSGNRPGVSDSNSKHINAHHPRRNSFSPSCIQNPSILPKAKSYTELMTCISRSPLHTHPADRTNTMVAVGHSDPLLPTSGNGEPTNHSSIDSTVQAANKTKSTGATITNKDNGDDDIINHGRGVLDQTSDAVEGTNTATHGDYDDDDDDVRGGGRGGGRCGNVEDTNAFRQGPYVESPPESQTGVGKATTSSACAVSSEQRNNPTYCTDQLPRIDAFVTKLDEDNHDIAVGKTRHPNYYKRRFCATPLHLIPTLVQLILAEAR